MVHYGPQAEGWLPPWQREARIRYDPLVPDVETYRVDSEAAMRRLGARLVRRLLPGDAVLLFGELGAGKTTLVRGALSELGYAQPVRSPTFNIVQAFETQPPVLHIDLYRVGSGDGLGIEDDAPTCVCFVEWPDEDAAWLDPTRTWRVEIVFEGPGRKVHVAAPAER